MDWARIAAERNGEKLEPSPRPRPKRPGQIYEHPIYSTDQRDIDAEIATMKALGWELHMCVRTVGHARLVYICSTV